MPFETPITIRQAVQNVLDGRYLLPSIQREFVWAPGQIEMLFDSILRGYPISSFLFWHVPEDQSNKWQFFKFLTNYHEANARHNEQAQLIGARDVTAVLDGQQRLTSLVIGLAGSYAYKLPNKRRSNLDAYPIRRLYIDLMHPGDEVDEDKRYALRFLTSQEATGDQERWWVSLPDLFQNMRSVSDLLKFMAKSEISSAPQQQRDFAASTLARICECLNTDPAINYFLEREADLDKVLQIFIRVNSGGTKLSYSDLLLSIATASWKGVDARQEIHDLVDTLNSYSDEITVSRDFVLKSCLVLSNISDIKFKVTNFNSGNMATIETQWPSIKDSMCLTLQLVKSFGLNDRSLLSNSALIPIAYYLHRRGAKQNYLSSASNEVDRVIIRRWLATVLLRGTFGSMTDTILSAIREVLSEAPCDVFPASAIAARLSKLNRSVRFTDEEIDGFLNTEYGDRRVFLLLSLLYPNFDYGNLHHVDHVYPRSKMTERRLVGIGVQPESAKAAAERRDVLSNLQLLEGSRNQSKSDDDFDVWLNRQYPDPTSRGYFLSVHHFPQMEAFTYESFDNFLAARKTILSIKLRKELNTDINV